MIPLALKSAVEFFLKSCSRVNIYSTLTVHLHGFEFKSHTIFVTPPVSMVPLPSQYRLFSGEIFKGPLFVSQRGM